MPAVEEQMINLVRSPILEEVLNLMLDGPIFKRPISNGIRAILMRENFQKRLLLKLQRELLVLYQQIGECWILEQTGWELRPDTEKNILGSRRV
jgi:uncharacterized protein YlaN (UPF0358 family)